MRRVPEKNQRDFLFLISHPLTRPLAATERKSINREIPRAQSYSQAEGKAADCPARTPRAFHRASGIEDRSHTIWHLAQGYLRTEHRSSSIGDRAPGTGDRAPGTQVPGCRLPFSVGYASSSLCSIAIAAGRSLKGFFYRDRKK